MKSLQQYLFITIKVLASQQTLCNETYDMKVIFSKKKSIKFCFLHSIIASNVGVSPIKYIRTIVEVIASLKLIISTHLNVKLFPLPFY